MLPLERFWNPTLKILKIENLKFEVIKLPWWHPQLLPWKWAMEIAATSSFSALENWTACSSLNGFNLSSGTSPPRNSTSGCCQGSEGGCRYGNPELYGKMFILYMSTPVLKIGPPHMYVYLSQYLNLYLYIYLSISISIYVWFCIYIFIYIYLNLSISTYRLYITKPQWYNPCHAWRDKKW